MFILVLSLEAVLKRLNFGRLPQNIEVGRRNQFFYSVLRLVGLYLIMLEKNVFD